MQRVPCLPEPILPLALLQVEFHAIEGGQPLGGEHLTDRPVGHDATSGHHDDAFDASHDVVDVVGHEHERAVVSREVTLFNLEAPLTRYEAISREVTLYNGELGP